MLTYHRGVQFRVDADTFRALPRHPDWVYEHLDGWAHLHYRPRPLDLVRDLAPVVQRAAPGQGRSLTRGLVVQPATEDDEDEVVTLVDQVWDELDPYRVHRAFAGTREASGDPESAGPRFARTLAGDDDPWEPGALVARCGSRAGAVAGVVTLSAWRPRDEDRPAQPAITWLTVSPRWRRSGVATALLAAAVTIAVESGADELHSAVSGANTPSVCWHWVNGFRPVPRVG